MCPLVGCAWYLSRYLASLPVSQWLQHFLLISSVVDYEGLLIPPDLHVVEVWYFKLWWLLPTVVLAGLGEVLGWSARYWSSLNDGILSTPFLIQYVH